MKENTKGFLGALVLTSIVFLVMFGLVTLQGQKLERKMFELGIRNPAVDLGDVPCELIKHNILYYPKCRFMDECAEVCLRERGYHCYSKEDLKFAYDIKGCGI